MESHISSAGDLLYVISTRELDILARSDLETQLQDEEGLLRMSSRLRLDPKQDENLRLIYLPEGINSKIADVMQVVISPVFYDKLKRQSELTLDYQDIKVHFLIDSRP